MINKTTKFFSYFFWLFILFSCKNEPSRLIKKNINKNEVVLLEFPDTIPVKTTIYGKVKYDPDLDSLTDVINARHTYFHITMTNEKIENLNMEKIKSMKHLSYKDTLNSGIFSFKMGSASPGNNLLIGVIEDIIIFKKNNNDSKIKIRTNETFITKNVYVQEP